MGVKCGRNGGDPLGPLGFLKESNGLLPHTSLCTLKPWRWSRFAKASWPFFRCLSSALQKSSLTSAPSPCFALPVLFFLRTAAIHVVSESSLIIVHAAPAGAQEVAPPPSRSHLFLVKSANPTAKATAKAHVTQKGQPEEARGYS